MKTRSPDGRRGDGLPPPPAPASRDANPWPMPQGAIGTQHEPRHPRAPGWPPSSGRPQSGPAGRTRRTPWIPLLYLLAALALASFVASLAQAKQDARYDAITWHIAEI